MVLKRIVLWVSVGVMLVLAGIGCFVLSVAYVAKHPSGVRPLFHEWEPSEHSVWWGWQSHGPHYDLQLASVYIDRPLNFILILGPQSLDKIGGWSPTVGNSADLACAWGRTKVDGKVNEVVVEVGINRRITLPLQAGVASQVEAWVHTFADLNILERIQNALGPTDKARLQQFLNGNLHSVSQPS
jgi:hypothetical protein